jgi:4-amino-4-deoxy-L-arabinose transferase-like glycosyltransferase
MTLVKDRLEARHHSLAVSRLALRHVKFFLLLASAALLFVAAYFSPHIWHHGEAREALVIQDIVENHHWLLPLRNHELPSKPILFHWIAAGFAMLFGLSDFIIRSPSVIAAVAMVWLTYRLGTLTGNHRIALLAVAILGATYEFWDSGTEARVDMLFAALLASSLTAWYLWYCSGAEPARAAAYLAVAGAVLTKGPAGAVLPILVIGSFVLAERNWSSLVKFISWPWIAIAVAIDVGWYLAAYYLGGGDLLYKQIIFENIDRFLGAGEFHTHKGLFSQAGWFITELFPWSLVLVWTLFSRWRGRPWDRFSLFLHCWWLGVFVFFLLARGQRAVYLLPIYPAVALLAARECAALWQGRRALRLSTIGWNWRAAAAGLLVALDLSFAVVVPIRRTAQARRSRQERFVENVVAAVPAGASLRAAMNFPETVLLVLAYRLNRNIERQPVNCDSQAYYFTAAEENGCAAGVAAVVVSSSDHRLNLLHLSTPSH